MDHGRPTRRGGDDAASAEARRLARLERDSVVKALAENVRTRCANAGWTIVQLAAAAKLDKTYVAQIARGERNPSLVTVVRLAAALGVSLDQLLTGLKRPPDAAHATVAKRRVEKGGAPQA